MLDLKRIDIYIRYKFSQCMYVVKNIPNEMFDLKSVMMVYIMFLTITVLFKKYLISAIVGVVYIILYIIYDYRKGEHIGWYRKNLKRRLMERELEERTDTRNQ